VSILWWLLRRLVIIGLQLLAVSIVVFGILYLSPGKPEQILLGTQPANPQVLAAIRAKYHLNDPIVSQYWLWLRHALHFDFGRSIQTGQTVTGAISERLPVTIDLAIYAVVLVVLIAVPLGLIAGTRPGTFVDRGITTVITIGFSAPAFALGLASLYVFGVTLHWFPIYGVGSGFVDRVRHLTLPAATLAMMVIALIARQTRASAMRVNDQDFMTFARVRGLTPRVIWLRYLLRNSALPVVTSIGLVIANFLTGAVIVEQTFALPGIGTLVLDAITTKDIPVVQAVGLLAAFIVLMANLVADLSYTFLDPRLRTRTSV